MVVGGVERHQQAIAIGDRWQNRRVPRFFDLAYEERTKLKDGTPILLRLIRPEDKALLRSGFERLSAESRYTRFFAPKLTLSDDELEYLCDIDHEKHFAIGAAREREDGTLEGLGVARFIVAERALGDGVAEAAVTVADHAQGRGLGRLLFQRLCAAANERGITKFRCEVLGTNAGMKHLLDAIAPDRQIEVSQGVMSFDIVVPQVSPTETIAGPSPESGMYRLFRAAAENTVDWTEAIRKLWGRGRTSSGE
jgi:GNAT superfamily N-acetyltransferase